MRLELAHPLRTDRLEALDAVLAGLRLERLEARQLVLRQGHDELADPLDLDPPLRAVRLERDLALAAEAGLERTRRVVQAGVDDAAVVAGLVGRELRLALDDQDPQPGPALEHLAGGREAEDPAADDEEVGALDGRGGRGRYRDGGLHRASLSRLPAEPAGGRIHGAVRHRVARIATPVRASARARSCSSGPPCPWLFPACLSTFHWAQPGCFGPDDLPAAGPRRPARRAELLAVDREDVDVGRAVLLFAGDRDVLADGRRQRRGVAPPPFRACVERVDGRSDRERELAVLAGRLADRAAERHRVLRRVLLLAGLGGLVGLAVVVALAVVGRGRGRRRAAAGAGRPARPRRPDGGAAVGTVPVLGPRDGSTPRTGTATTTTAAIAATAATRRSVGRVIRSAACASRPTSLKDGGVSLRCRGAPTIR